MRITGDVNERLAELNDDYVYRLNVLIAEGREAEADRLSDEYLHDAADLLHTT